MVKIHSSALAPPKTVAYEDIRVVPRWYQSNEFLKGTLKEVLGDKEVEGGIDE